MNLILLKRRQIRRVRARLSTSQPTEKGDEGAKKGDEGEEQLLVDLTGLAAQHCFSVLKVQVGSSLKVGVFNGGICSANVVAVNQHPLSVQIHLERDIAREPSASPAPLIDLLLAIPRPKTLDKILQVSATLGVGRLLLVCSERVEKGYLSSPKLSRENIEKQLQTGLEQGVSTRVPEVQVFASWQALMVFLRRSRSPCTFHSQQKDQIVRESPDSCLPANGVSTALSGSEGEQGGGAERTDQRDSHSRVPWCCYTSAVGRSRRLLAHPGVDATLPSLKMQAHSGGRVLVAIGPEGGWIDQEVEELRETQGFEFFSLGDRVLRCETAVVSVIAQLNMLLQDTTLRAGLPPACASSEEESQATSTWRNVSPDARVAQNVVDEARRRTSPGSSQDDSTTAGKTELEGDKANALPSASSCRELVTQSSKKERNREGVRQVHRDEDGRIIVLPQKFSQHRSSVVCQNCDEKSDTATHCGV
ncbi:RNA methyltransferase [Toxoplasma gondii VAND]|uniref:16S rRNA (uracil(1498)-N(3))-methyltransferase n=1 Tax=Toxoplasma gondii VAND TaxID=933077 RepID=A0A086PYW0_TOXGO|nr:RNA methyltransferase [Toxoplasma gondii VAND]